MIIYYFYSLVYNYLTICNNFTIFIFIKIPSLQEYTCTQLAFVISSGTTNIYINGVLIYENMQLNNFFSFIYNYITSYLNYINSISFYNIAFNSDQISNNYNLYVNNCTYCTSSSKQNYLINYSGKYKFFFIKR